jgi:hypothetical protein
LEILQLTLEAFQNSPVFFIVPLGLIAFVAFSPWSPERFYIHHDQHSVDDADLG